MAAIYFVSLALLILCAVLSVWRGGAWERATAIALGLVWIGTTLTPFDGVTAPPSVLLMDTAVALLILYGAIFSDRRWMLWAAAFQLLVLANHLAFIRFHEIQQWAYVTGSYLWGDAVLVALAVGALTRKHRQNPTVKLQDDKNARR